jgi:hypothetical protein
VNCARRTIEPDQAALEIARRLLRATASLDELLRVPALRIVLRTVAREHMRKRAMVDVKKLQANDND